MAKHTRTRIIIIHARSSRAPAASSKSYFIMCRRKLSLIMAITLLLAISGSVLRWTSSAHFIPNNDVVIVQDSSTPLNHRDKPNYSDISGFIANSVTVQESSTPLNHRDKPNYSGNTTIEATSLSRHSGITELTPLSGLQAHVGIKQSLPALPSVPADMPFPEYIKSREELQKSECVSELYNYLLSLDKSVSPHVNMVFGDNQHTNLILNWLIAALLRLEPPLHNVLVISLDRLLCDTLTAKKLPLTCIVVSVECILVSKINDGGERGWEKRLMVRHPVLRLINYWGYDVANYDSDAVLLRNPQPLYEERPHMSVLAASSNFPKVVGREWGFVVCAGVIVLRSSPSLGEWESHDRRIFHLRVCYNICISSGLQIKGISPYIRY